MKDIIGMEVTLKKDQLFGPDWDDTDSIQVIGLAGNIYEVTATTKDTVELGNGALYMSIENFKKYFLNKKEKQMEIKIYTKKEVSSNGVMGRRIINVEGPGKEKLPELYLKNENAICVNDFTGQIYFSTSFVDLLKKGKFYSEEDFQEALKKITLAGDILHDVNRELTKLKKSWKGEETFVI